MLKAKLEIVGGAKPSEVELKRFPATIGRAREASIRLPHNLVSRLHCEILEKNGELHVQDLNSLNGTYVNNEKISGSRPLLPGQLLTLGIVTFRAVYEVGNENQIPDVEEDSDTSHWQHGETIPVDVPNDMAKEFPSRQINGAAIASAEVGPRFSAESDTDEQKAVAANRFALDTDGQTESIQIVDDELISAPASICLAEMMKLPHPDRCAASFSGGLEINGSSDRSATEDNQVQIDFGDDQTARAESSQSAIDSFVRKLPR